RVRDRRAVATDGVRDVLLGETELGDQTLVAARLVHRRQVVALKIFARGEREPRPIVDLALDGGDFFPAESLTRAQPTLAGDQLEGAPPLARRRGGGGGDGTHDHWLQ